LAEKTDTEQIMAARKGDKEAFGVLVQRYQAAARRYALRLTGDNDWASELVQEATLQAYLSLEHLRDPGRYKSWLYGIILNVHRNRLRESRNSVSLDGVSVDLQPDIDISDTPLGIAEQTEQNAMLLEAVNRLSLPYKDVIQNFYFRGLTLLEIASSTGISEGAVKVRLHRARLKLKALLKSGYPEIIPLKGGKQMIPVTIADISKQERKDAEGHTIEMYVILLLDKAGQKVLPVWVGAFEASSIAIGMRDVTAPRPLTYDFFTNLLKAAGTKIEEVRVETLKDTTFYGVVKVTRGRTTREVDARPSDALALAVRTGSPIFVAEEVMERAGVPVTTKTPPDQVGVDAITKEVSETIRKTFAKFLPKKEDVDVVKNLIEDVRKS
jgi:RNA polymerase sigma factor (sigma-70 family)